MPEWDIESIKKAVASKELVGVCQNKQGSPGNMQCHLRSNVHKIETVQSRLEQERAEVDEAQGEQGDAEKAKVVDMGMSRDFVYHYILEDLQPLRICNKPGVKKTNKSNPRR